LKRTISVSDADIDQFKTLNRGVVPKLVGRLVTGLYFSWIIFDIVCLVGTAMRPHVIAGYACAIRPLGVIAWPLFSEDLLRYSADQCLGAMEEPSTSIILLSIKYAIGILIVPMACGFVAYRPQGLLTLVEASFLGAKTSEAYYRELKRWGLRLVVVGALDIAGILFSSGSKVADFDTSIVHKISLEDGFAAILIPASVFYGLIFLVGVSLSLVEHRKSTSNDDKRM
jgi:hypothetical protein